VDGVLKATVDTYAPAAVAQAVLYTVTGLPRGTHTLRIWVNGTRSNYSGGVAVWVDAFDVIP
jgi:hypothetical protein